MGHKNYRNSANATMKLIHAKPSRRIYLREINGKFQLVEFVFADPEFNLWGNRAILFGTFLRNGRLWDTRELAEKYLIKYLRVEKLRNKLA